MAALQACPTAVLPSAGRPVSSASPKPPGTSAPCSVQSSACSTRRKPGFSSKNSGFRATVKPAACCCHSLLEPPPGARVGTVQTHQAVGASWLLGSRGTGWKTELLGGRGHEERRRGRPEGLGVQHRRRGRPMAALNGSGPSGGEGGEGGKGQKELLSNSTLNLLIGGILLGLLATGQLDFFDGVLQFVAGVLLTMVLLVALLIQVMEGMVEKNEGVGANTSGNCPWCGSAQKVLDIMAVHEGRPVPQQCLGCQECFTVEKGIFVRASPRFDEDPNPMRGGRQASSWQQSNAWQAASNQEASHRKKGFGSKRAKKAKSSERSDVRPIYEPSHDVVDIEAVVADKD